MFNMAFHIQPLTRKASWYDQLIHEIGKHAWLGVTDM